MNGSSFSSLCSEGGNGNFSQKWQGKQVPPFSKHCPEENNKPKVWSGVSSAGVGSGKDHENDWGRGSISPERAGVVQPRKEKASGRTLQHPFITFRGLRRKTGTDFILGPVMIERGVMLLD